LRCFFGCVGVVFALNILFRILLLGPQPSLSPLTEVYVGMTLVGLWDKKTGLLGHTRF